MKNSILKSYVWLVQALSLSSSENSVTPPKWERLIWTSLRFLSAVSFQTSAWNMELLCLLHWQEAGWGCFLEPHLPCVFLSGCWDGLSILVSQLMKPADGIAMQSPAGHWGHPGRHLSSLDQILSQLYSALSQWPLWCTLPHPASQGEVELQYVVVKEETQRPEREDYRLLEKDGTLGLPLFSQVWPWINVFPCPALISPSVQWWTGTKWP